MFSSPSSSKGRRGDPPGTPEPPGTGRNSQREKPKGSDAAGGIQRSGQDFWDEPGQAGSLGEALELLEKLEIGGAGRNQREKVEEAPSGIQLLGEDFWDGPDVPDLETWDENGLGAELDQAQAGSSEDEEDEPDWEACSENGPGAESGSSEDEEGESSGSWQSDTEGQNGEREPALVLALSCRALEEEFPAVWARSPLDCGRLDEEERLDGPPVSPRQPRPPRPQDEPLMAELLREYLERGIVVESASDSESALILVQKPHGRGWRLSLDCRALNASTPLPPPERPSPERTLAGVSPRSRFFSVIDLADACLAIPLARSCWGRFGFTFGGRRFVFTRLPPTFRGSGSALHRRLRALLARLEPAAAAGVHHCYDDILVCGKSRRQAEHRTRLVLQLLQRSGLKANRAKAQLVRRQVSYLGVTVSAAGRAVSAERLREIRALCQAPGPWDAQRLRCVLGKLGSCKGFIRDFCELALPLQRLLGQRSWEWGPEQRRQLRRLREALEAAPALRFPDRSRPFVLRLWLYAETAGAELLQEKSAGVLVPVERWSRRLARWNLSPRDAWSVAAARALRDLEMLTGKAPVVIRDPSGNFLLRGEQFFTGGSPGGSPGGSGPQEQWTLLVDPEGPEPQESQSVSIPLAPPLDLMLPVENLHAHVWFLAMEKGSIPVASIGFAAANLEGRRMDGVTGGGSEEDAELVALRELLEQHRSRFPLFLYCSRPGLAARLERLERPERGWDPSDTSGSRVLRWLRAFPGMLQVRELSPAEAAGVEQLRELSSSALVLGCITRSSWIRWKPCRAQRQEIVARCHGPQHAGLELTLARVHEVGSCGDDHQDVSRWLQNCPQCGDSGAARPPAPQRAQGPWSCVRLSVSEPLPRSPEGFRALLLVQDARSGWLDAVPLPQRAEPAVRRALLRDVFGALGSVRCLLLPPQPAWLWECLAREPLSRFWSRRQRSGPQEAADSLLAAVRAMGSAWSAALPLLLSAARSRCVRPERLGPLLCVPGLPLELRWGCRTAQESGQGELSHLRGLRLRDAPRQRLERELSRERGEGTGTRDTGSRDSEICGVREWDGLSLQTALSRESAEGLWICGVRNWGKPDPGSRFARDWVRLRWVRDWERPGQELRGAGSAIGTGLGWAEP